MQTLKFLLAFVLASGCAAKKMAAENADFVLESQIEKRLPLYSAQKEALSKDVDKFLNEQKGVVKAALPVVNQLELKEEKVDEQYHRLKSVYDQMALNFSKLMSTYMALLDEKQKNEFLENLSEENEKISKHDDDDIMERVHDRFETLFGTISEAQEKTLGEFKAYYKQRSIDRLVRRKELHQKFAEIYRMEVSKESRTNYFYTAFKAYQEKAVDSENNLKMIKKILPTLSEKQKENFKGRIQDLKEILGHFLEADY